MNSEKVRKFMKLAGQSVPNVLSYGTDEERRLGAQLLLSEVLEYVIHGLGVTPSVNGVPITEPNALEYSNADEPDKLQMLDGLADVAYTMYWNSEKFGLPLEQAYDLVCDNNLQKFVHLPFWKGIAGPLERDNWSCGRDVHWPPEVVQVEVLNVQGEYYAVGKDSSGKVRKPSTYAAVELCGLLP